MRQPVPDLADAIDAWYAETVKRLWRDAAENFKGVDPIPGFDQGCPISAGAFAVGLQGVLELYYAELKVREAEAQLFAHLDDDVCIFSDPRHV